jgi:two-component system, OmpR family, sensor histidine kinase CiaH
VTRSTHGHVARSLRVAIVATAIVGLVLLLAVIVLNVFVTHRLVEQADTRLSQRLDQAAGHPASMRADIGAPAGGAQQTLSTDPDDAPVFAWLVTPGGQVEAATPGAPRLPIRGTPQSGTATVSPPGSSAYRVVVRPVTGGFLIAAVSLANAGHVEDLIHLAEGVLGPIGLLGVFFGALIIGLKASGPIEEARVRQLEFTADASHELRTPLSVIDAEVDLALQGQRDVASYRSSLERVKRESGRLRHIVQDLLWLARVDSAPANGGRERVDLATVVQGCMSRFRPVAASRELTLTHDLVDDGTAWTHASADDLDRLVVVLLDNACRYTPRGGTVRVSVSHRGARVSLVVEDSGPGIAPEQRPLLFDRFHRASDEPGGTGLGLAIADSIVRASGGQWSVGDSSLGGARMEVSWHRARRDRSQAPGLHEVVRNPA